MDVFFRFAMPRCRAARRFRCDRGGLLQLVRGGGEDLQEAAARRRRSLVGPERRRAGLDSSGLGPREGETPPEFLFFSPTAESFGVSAQIGSGVVLSGRKVPRGFHQGSTRGSTRGHFSSGGFLPIKNLGESPDLVGFIFPFAREAHLFLSNRPPIETPLEGREAASPSVPKGSGGSQPLGLCLWGQKVGAGHPKKHLVHVETHGTAGDWVAMNFGQHVS